MPVDPFFTSAVPRRSAAAWAREKADPALLSLTGQAKADKVLELNLRKNAGEYLTNGEYWFLRYHNATWDKKRQIGCNKMAIRIKEKYQTHKPYVVGGYNTAT